MAAAMVATLDARLAAGDAQITAHDDATNAADQVAAVQAAGKALLSPDFVMIPEFTLDNDQAGEWTNAYGASTSLLDYVTNTLMLDFPVDEWLYGTARVREKMAHWERVVMLAETFGTTPLTLTPVQFPFAPNDSWLGLEFPDDYEIDSDRLLYTAHYPVAFNAGAAQCGLLVDEWTEVIPGTRETSGLTFHYDRPNAEPPQVMLLALSPSLTGEWNWQDLVSVLDDTLVMARKRAVEPEQIDKTAFARFLPATVMAVTLRGLTISANLAVNNHVFDVLTGD